MSIQLQDIITLVRDTVSDPSASRWDDTTITRYIKRGLREFTRDSEILTRWEDVVAPTSCPYTFKLPTNMITLDRVTFNNKPIKIVSHAWMDARYPNWQTKQTNLDITHIVIDKQDKGSIRLYPTPKDIAIHYFNNDTNYGVLTIPANNKLGLFHNLEQLADGSLCSPDELTNYGILNSLTLFKVDLDFFFTIKGEEEVLDKLDDMWLNALAHYAVGHMLRSDRDEQQRRFGNEELRLYQKELLVAKAHKARNFTNNHDIGFNYTGFHAVSTIRNGD